MHSAPADRAEEGSREGRGLPQTDNTAGHGHHGWAWRRALILYCFETLTTVPGEGKRRYEDEELY